MYICVYIYACVCVELKPAQLKELLAGFAKVETGVAKPTRKLRAAKRMKSKLIVVEMRVGVYMCISILCICLCIRVYMCV